MKEGLEKLPFDFVSRSPSETEEFGKRLVNELPPDSLLCFFGDIGAGKTTLIKGIASALTELGPYEINSPTFTYLNIYEGKSILFHFDLYRLKNSEEFLAYGFDEYFYLGAMCCIEWAERIDGIIPPNQIAITIKHQNQNERLISVR